MTKLRQKKFMEIHFIIPFRNCYQPIFFPSHYQHKPTIYQEPNLHVVLDEGEKHGLLL
jgi:hypothetical protein